MRAHRLEKLSDKQSQPESQLKFIIEAWLQAQINHPCSLPMFVLLCIGTVLTLVELLKASVYVGIMREMHERNLFNPCLLEVTLK
ncbi:hypothetical protein CsSME_00019906 [Camellia sinensis var. sinensis]